MIAETQRVVVIIQARMGSTRLPGKVLSLIDEKPLLLYQLERIQRATLVDQIVIALPTNPLDDPIVEMCERNNIQYFRGSEHDVLGRYFECAERFSADVVVRCTGDCPLIDPSTIDQSLERLLSEDLDYIANTVPPTTRKYPDGSDVEVFTMQALRRANLEVTDPHEREHVTFGFWMGKNSFTIAQLDFDQDYSEYRYTVDYPPDLEVVQFIVDQLGKTQMFGSVEQIVSILDSNPDVKSKNERYKFGSGWEQKSRDL